MTIITDFKRSEMLYRNAAKAWVRGNNSGDPRRLEMCQRICERQRRDATALVMQHGVTRVCFPGLYPTFDADGKHYYRLADILRDRNISTGSLS